jgi:hypothetical protein
MWDLIYRSVVIVWVKGLLKANFFAARSAIRREDLVGDIGVMAGFGGSGELRRILRRVRGCV